MTDLLKPSPLGVVGNNMDTKSKVSVVTEALMKPTIDKVKDTTKDFVIEYYVRSEAVEKARSGESQKN